MLLFYLLTNALCFLSVKCAVYVGTSGDIDIERLNLFYKDIFCREYVPQEASEYVMACVEYTLCSLIPSKNEVAAITQSDKALRFQMELRNELLTKFSLTHDEFIRRMAFRDENSGRLGIQMAEIMKEACIITENFLRKMHHEKYHKDSLTYTLATKLVPGVNGAEGYYQNRKFTSLLTNVHYFYLAAMHLQKSPFLFHPMERPLPYSMCIMFHALDVARNFCDTELLLKTIFTLEELNVHTGHLETVVIGYCSLYLRIEDFGDNFTLFERFWMLTTNSFRQENAHKKLNGMISFANNLEIFDKLIRQFFIPAVLQIENTGTDHFDFVFAQLFANFADDIMKELTYDQTVFPGREVFVSLIEAGRFHKNENREIMTTITEFTSKQPDPGDIPLLPNRAHVRDFNDNFSLDQVKITLKPVVPEFYSGINEYHNCVKLIEILNKCVSKHLRQPPKRARFDPFLQRSARNIYSN